MKILFIHGFLGSGKTTFINQLLSEYVEYKIGVIINEFGSEGVDKHLINLPLEELIEVKAGSIFCSCKSDELLTGLTKMISLGLDWIFVEASGFANPKSLGLIMASLTTQDDKIEQWYNITILDGIYFPKLLHTLVIVKEQMAVADMVIFNKTDILEINKIQEVDNIIASLTEVPIIHTSYGKTNNILAKLVKKQLIDSSEIQSRDLRLQQFVLTIDNKTRVKVLSLFLEAIKGDVFRAKGIIELLEGKMLCQLSSQTVTVEPSDKKSTALVILYSSKMTNSLYLQGIFERIKGNLYE